MNQLSEINYKTANLPQTYEDAKTALATCSNLDECKDWSDKAQALASYGRMADDNSLVKYAERIRARAIRRAGEVLKTFDGRGAHMKKDGGDLSQRQAADEAGFSERQTKQAVNVANIPENEFEAAIEGDESLSISKLALLGVNPRKNESEYTFQPPDGFKSATELMGSVSRFVEFCQSNEPANVSSGLLPHEIEQMRRQVSIIDSWLDVFVTNLKG